MPADLLTNGILHDDNWQIIFRRSPHFDQVLLDGIRSMYNDLRSDLFKTARNDFFFDWPLASSHWGVVRSHVSAR
jgi:hypothetical protein